MPGYKPFTLLSVLRDLTHVGKSLQEPVLPAAKALEVVGVDGPDHGAAELMLQDVVGLHLEALLVVVAKPLVSLVAVGSYDFLFLRTELGNVIILFGLWDVNIR